MKRFLFILLLLSGVAHAQYIPLGLSTQAMLSLDDVDRADSIRVKIFPHMTKRPPQGLDQRFDVVTFRSSSGCKVAGNTVKEITFQTANLIAPVAVQCADGMTLVRPGGVRSYSYAGEFLVQKKKTSGGDPYVQIVQTLAMDDYVKGVVPVEMPASWPIEALKAQAIAARTYALFNDALMSMNGDVGYDVDDTVLFQAYTGTTDRADPSDQAVEATHGQYMTYESKIIQSYFHAYSGGFTEDAANVWPVVAPYCVGKKEAYDESLLDPSRWGSWKVHLTLDRLTRMLRDADWVSDDDSVASFSTPDELRDASGRMKFVSLRLKSGKAIQIPGTRFRQILGLNSTLFSYQPDASLIVGRGFGHGVGMSQVGAMVLAAQLNWTAPQILQFYYTGITLEQAPAGLLY